MELHVASLIFSFLFIRDSSTGVYEWKCTDEFCQNINCPQLPKECMNKSKALLISSITPCNCCDHCLLFQVDGEDCLKGPAELQLPPYICEPGHLCNENGKCVKMKTEDPQFFPNYICKNGKCKCAVLTTELIPLPIFGEFDEDKMIKNETQCACSVVAYKAMSQTFQALPFKDIYQPTVRCLKNGQFDPLQCIDDMCGCVEMDTGTPDENNFKYYIKTLSKNHPKCFDPTRHRKGEYYTECENKRNQLMKEGIEGFWNNVDLIHFESVNCKPDGTYAD